MAINPHDDYEKLAKLLYPSIEASGNVYYGQTRKLTMDEVLNKNDLGFESHPEYYSNSKTCSFCWKLGPLHDKIIFNTDVYNTSYVTDNTFSNYTVEFNDTIDNNINVYYAKYLINIESSSIVNTTHSAEYNTYENNISLELQSILACTSKLYEDKNFFIEDNQYLYVLILTDAPYVGNGSSDEDESIDNLDEANMPLTIKNVGSSIMQVSVYLVVDDDEESTTTQLSDLRINSYKYKTSNDTEFNNLNGWSIVTRDDQVPVVIGAESAKIDLNPGEYVQFICTNFAGNHPSGDWLYNHKTYHTLRITGNNAVAEAYGNILSMFGEDFSTVTYVIQDALHKLFLNCTSLIRAPYIPPANYFNRAIQRTFMGCTSLKQTPNLHLLPNSSSNALGFTFVGCTSLVTVNDILVDSATIDLSSTFYGCNSVNKVTSIKTVNNGEIKLVNTQDTPTHDEPLPWTFFGNSNSSLTSIVLNVSPDEIILDSSSVNWLPPNNGIIYLNPKYILDNRWDSLILENWIRKPILTYKFNYIDNNYPKEVISYGSNNNQNGRGNIYDVSTINNFEKSFDESGTHQMNSYNQDGSYNQEIWGYKSFNSPVQFRNGIYGEKVYLTAADFDFNFKKYNTKLYSDITNPDTSSYGIRYYDESGSGVSSTTGLGNNTYLKTYNLESNVTFQAYVSTLDSMTNSTSVVTSEDQSSCHVFSTKIVTSVKELPLSSFIETAVGSCSEFNVNVNDTPLNIRVEPSDTKYVYAQSLLSAGKAAVKVKSDNSPQISNDALNSSSVTLAASVDYQHEAVSGENSVELEVNAETNTISVRKTDSGGYYSPYKFKVDLSKAECAITSVIYPDNIGAFNLTNDYVNTYGASSVKGRVVTFTSTVDTAIGTDAAGIELPTCRVSGSNLYCTNPGSIMLVVIKQHTGSESAKLLHAGEVINTSEYSIRIATSTNSGFVYSDTATFTSNHYFKLLNSVNWTEADKTAYLPALVVKTVYYL